MATTEPEAPLRFSITTGLAEASPSFGWTMRAMVSVEPPGGKGTISRTGRSGQAPCVRETAGADSPAAVNERR